MDDAFALQVLQSHRGLQDPSPVDEGDILELNSLSLGQEQLQTAGAYASCEGQRVGTLVLAAEVEDLTGLRLHFRLLLYAASYYYTPTPEPIPSPKSAALAVVLPLDC
jgi:hypothetical protein